MSVSYKENETPDKSNDFAEICVNRKAPHQTATSSVNIAQLVKIFG